MKRIIAALLTLVSISLLCGSVFAEGSGSIKVTPPEGTQADAKNTYTLYKVFDATGKTEGGVTSISYKLHGTHNNVPEGFVLDDGGNVYFADVLTAEEEGSFKVFVGGNETILKAKTELTKDDIKNIWNYVKDDTDFVSKTVTGMDPAEFTGLDYGFYYVTTTTGSLVIIDSVEPDVDIKDKNKVPSLDKTVTGPSFDEAGKNAIAEVGKDVDYTITVTKQSGAENYTVEDTLVSLKYNNDAVVTVTNDKVDPPVTIEATEGSDYSVDYTETASDAKLTIAFDNDYIASLADGTEIVITYSAKVTSDALTVNAAKNTAHLSYGHSPASNKTPDKEVKVYNATLAVNKVDDKNVALPGAKFVLKNSKGEYYKSEFVEGAIESIVWTTIEAAEVKTSDANGKLSFTGLGVGTYTLVETEAPLGYNKAADYEFEVSADDLKKETINLEYSATVINKQGAEMPSTGGIGTTIFYIVGISFIAFAVVLFMRRKAR